MLGFLAAVRAFGNIDWTAVAVSVSVTHTMIFLELQVSQVSGCLDDDTPANVTFFMNGSISSADQPFVFHES